jgi:hypothetical protein
MMRGRISTRMAPFDLLSFIYRAPILTAAYTHVFCPPPRKTAAYTHMCHSSNGITVCNVYECIREGSDPQQADTYMGFFLGLWALKFCQESPENSDIGA